LRLGFEADAVDRAIDFWNAGDLGDRFAQAIVPGEVDRPEVDILAWPWASRSCEHASFKRS
jgi:hypothetical protein